MADPVLTPAPAPGVSPPSPPVPGSLEAARRAGRKVGEAYGEFRAWAKAFSDLFTDTAATGGVVLWNRLTPERRLEAIAVVQRAHDALPKLPPATSMDMARALREGFQEGAKARYESERILARAVWVAAELAKGYAMARGATPVPIAIGAYTTKDIDCAARTAARAILEMNGVEVPAERLIDKYGLPKTVLSGYEDAVSYARNWLTGVGLRLAARPGGFHPVAKGGVAGRYVIFMKGGAPGGHVVFGEVTATEMRIIDDQAGKVWSSVEEAQRALGLRVTSVSRIEGITLPE